MSYQYAPDFNWIPPDVTSTSQEIPTNNRQSKKKPKKKPKQWVDFSVPVNFYPTTSPSTSQEIPAPRRRIPAPRRRPTKKGKKRTVKMDDELNKLVSQQTKLGAIGNKKKKPKKKTKPKK